MARTVRNAKLDSRSARSKLARRREPYWTVISKGCALGYRKGAKGGNWIARYRDETGKQHYEALGAADDALEADGMVSLTYSDAQRKAEGWFKTAVAGFDNGAARTGPYTLASAMADYLDAHVKRGGKSEGQIYSAMNAYILPSLGDIPCAKLTRNRVEKFHQDIAATAPMVRTKPGEPTKHLERPEGGESDRKRKATANRILATLKAALNVAHERRRIASDEAWRHVKPFRQVDGRRVRYLSDNEAKRLVNASSPAFRPVVQAALLTGCRYGELCALKVEDYNPDAGTLHIRVNKAGKARHIVLTEEGQLFFTQSIAGKAVGEPIFLRTGGLPWARSHQRRPFKEACRNAKLGDLTFHELRHTYASRLVMNGAPLPVVAAQLGHSDTRMVEKHYGHMSDNYVAETVRAAFGEIGVVEDNNVKKIST